MDISVIKRDSSLEPFSPEKIARVVTAAGLEPDQALILARTVSQQLLHQGSSPVSSRVIRDLVITALHQISPAAAGLYTWYEKTKENNHAS